MLVVDRELVTWIANHFQQVPRIMPRPSRADEAGAIDHALNRGDTRHAIFQKVGDDEAFEWVLVEGLKKYPVRCS